MELRPYQQQAVDDLRAAYRAKKRMPLFVLPTGGGKTFTFVFTAKGAVASGRRVCILVHRQELLKQASRSLDAMGVAHGLIAPGKSISRDPVQVASVQTLIRRIKKHTDAGQPLPDVLAFDLIIVDEAHHATAGSWRQVLDAYPRAHGLGVTATPTRSDGQGLGVAGGGVFDEMVVGPSIADLIDWGYLVRPKVYAPPTDLDLSGVKRRFGDYDQKEIAARMDKPTITGSAVEHYRMLCPGQPAIAFCASVAHAEHVAADFRAAGFRAQSLDGSMDDTTRDGAIRALGTGQLDVLTSCDIISEGTDIPVVAAAILLRPTQSLGLYIQQVGRALRPVYAPGLDLSAVDGRLAAIAASAKPRAIILDHVGNVLRHDLPDAEREWSLEAEKKKRRSKSDDGERAPAVRQCEKCYHVFPAAPVCPNCGHFHEVKGRKLAEQDGTLQEIDEATAAAIRKQRRAELAQCHTLGDFLALSKQRGYKPSWAHIQYKLRSKKGRINEADSATI